MNKAFNFTLDRRSFVALIVGGLALGLAPFPSLAKDLVSKTKKGVAIKGYDTIAYFQSGKATKGKKGHVVEWNGASWRFATEEEATLFATSPTDYAPQFGGFCARAMSLKRVVPSNPKVWRLHDGKLYLFAAPRGGKAFDKDAEKIISKAQAYWDSL